MLFQANNKKHNRGYSSVGLKKQINSVRNSLREADDFTFSDRFIRKNPIKHRIAPLSNLKKCDQIDGIDCFPEAELKCQQEPVLEIDIQVSDPFQPEDHQVNEASKYLRLRSRVNSRMTHRAKQQSKSYIDQCLQPHNQSFKTVKHKLLFDNPCKPSRKKNTERQYHAVAQSVLSSSKKLQQLDSEFTQSYTIQSMVLSRNPKTPRSLNKQEISQRIKDSYTSQSNYRYGFQKPLKRHQKLKTSKSKLNNFFLSRKTLNKGSDQKTLKPATPQGKFKSRVHSQSKRYRAAIESQKHEDLRPWAENETQEFQVDFFPPQQ